MKKIVATQREVSLQTELQGHMKMKQLPKKCKLPIEMRHWKLSNKSSHPWLQPS